MVPTVRRRARARTGPGRDNHRKVMVMTRKRWWQPPWAGWVWLILVGIAVMIIGGTVGVVQLLIGS